jgi:hypothetical protein
MSVSEDTVEQATIEWFEEVGYAYLAGPGIAPGEPEAERDSSGDVVLQGWLTAAIDRLNPRDSVQAPAHRGYPGGRCLDKMRLPAMVSGRFPSGSPE